MQEISCKLNIPIDSLKHQYNKSYSKNQKNNVEIKGDKEEINQISELERIIFIGIINKVFRSCLLNGHHNFNFRLKNSSIHENTTTKPSTY